MCNENASCSIHVVYIVLILYYEVSVTFDVHSKCYDIMIHDQRYLSIFIPPSHGFVQDGVLDFLSATDPSLRKVLIIHAAYFTLVLYHEVSFTLSSSSRPFTLHVC